LHLLKQGAKPTVPRKERKKFAAAAFVPAQASGQAEEEEKKEPEPGEMEGVFYQDPAGEGRQTKRNR
jgi:hypothetical protein